MSTARWLARPTLAAAAVLLGTCGGDEASPPLPDHGPPPALTGALLGFDGAAAAAANAASLPAGFTGPMETNCAADVTRGFISELSDHGLTNPQVAYEWAPMAPGPSKATPTIGQPEFFASGSVVRLERSGLDFRPSHPFGFDTTWDFRVDAPFLGLVHNRAGDPNDGDIIHTELESGLFPDAAFGMAPTAGDRVLVKGAWIFDCGHPPYEAEVHPPTFVALARADATATESLAFGNAFRTSQLYGDADLTTKFADDARLADPGTGPFTQELTGEVLRAAFGQIDHFELHSLIEATHFEPLTWFVCAPARPSASAKLVYSYRFVARTGVAVSVARRGDSGCLELHAEESAGYVPFVPQRKDYAWSWDQINAEASSQVGETIDVRLLILDALAEQGLTSDVPALHSDTATVIDQYAPLAPRAGADADSPSAVVTGADDQPFPFYGRVRVAWE